MSFQSVIPYLETNGCPLLPSKTSDFVPCQGSGTNFLLRSIPIAFLDYMGMPVAFPSNDCDDTPAGGLPTPVTAAATTSNALLSPLAVAAVHVTAVLGKSIRY
jgi:hypothetical protein